MSAPQIATDDDLADESDTRPWPLSERMVPVGDVADVAGPEGVRRVR